MTVFGQSPTKGPYAWADEKGEMHFSIPAYLEVLGAAETPENIDQAHKLAMEAIRKLLPTATIITDA